MVFVFRLASTAMGPIWQCNSGCLNHALLTAEAIAARGLIIAGWVANCCTTPEMTRFAENLATLEELLLAPLLGVLPHDPQGGPLEAASRLQLPA